MQLRGCSSQQHRHLGLNRCSRRNVACVSAERQQQHGTSSSSLEHAQPQQPPPPAITSQQPQPQAQLLCSPQVGVAAIRAQQQVQQQAEPLQDSVLQQIVGQSGKLPNQADQLWGDPSDRESRDVALVEPATRSYADLDYLSELLAIQQDDGPKNLGFFGTRNMGMTHQKLVEILSYAMVSSGNHIYTSGATGTNAAVIKGALRAEKPELLTVILPQSLSRQPQESQELLAQVQNIIEMPHNDELSLLEASRHCNREIIGKVQQVICFAFHDSRLLLETCAEAKDSKKIVTLFYLD